ncbi:MAG: hypothetical protein ACRC0Y_08905 [Fusobacteriaceae bacterium]
MNVLSIDIDFLFTDMKRIQECFDLDLSPERSWKVVEWKNENKKFEVCSKSAKFLNNVLKEKVTGTTIVETITEHDEIIKVLEKHNCEDSYMINIDYHHDISYEGDDKELNIENWVLHARKNNLVGKYSWICQDDSEKCLSSTILYDCCSWKDVGIENIPKIDLVVLCTSKHFTPPKYWELTKEIEKDINYLIQKLILIENN